MSHAPSSSLKEKEKEIQKKRNIKSRKIDRRKRKMLVSKAFHNKWRCWILVLSFELWLHTSCHKVLIENIMNHPSFQKFQLKCS